MNETYFRQCKIYFPYIRVICITPKEDNNSEFERIKKDICENFSYYESYDLMINDRDKYFYNDEIIKNIIINLKTALYVEFDTVIDNTIDEIKYKMEIINIDIINYFHKEDNLALIKDDILYNNIMAIYARIRTILLCNIKKENLLQSKINKSNECDIIFCDTYINGIKIEEHKRTNCVVHLQNTHLKFNHVNLIFSNNEYSRSMS